jgi:hypothetical protein
MGRQRTKTPTPLFRVTQKSRNIHVVDIELKSLSEDRWFLLSSDRHHDNPHSDHDLELKHLREAVDRGAGIVDLGDSFCAMGGRGDPRRAKHGVTRPEHAMANDYFDSLVTHAADFYAPFARNFVVIARGNHETSVLKNQETDLTERLCERMSAISRHRVYSGGYGGWVLFRIKYTTQVYCLNMKYFHGSGGGGLMTMDTLRVRRIGSWTPDADVIAGGHTHDKWVMEVERERLKTKNGDYKVELSTQYHVRCGTYKDEYGDGFGGWHIERGGPPKSLGAVWMKLCLSVPQGESKDRRVSIKFERAD